MGSFHRESHDRKKSGVARGQSTGAETVRSSRRFSYSQTNGWQQGSAARARGRANRLAAFNHRWFGRFE
ncbi:MAG TPA: hypothetical protein VHX65_12185 [Pirellulales bacterium]|jgi:hypothetical protein|nr:hypothetical protein [Pirellulales bacterium]